MRPDEARLLKSHNIYTAFRSIYQLQNLFFNSKPKTPPLDLLGVVYVIPCRDCDSLCIRESGRTDGIRLKEHTRSFAKCDMTSKIISHSTNMHHFLSLDNIKILDSGCLFYKACIFLEGWRTVAQLNSINEACAVACVYSFLLLRVF